MEIIAAEDRKEYSRFIVERVAAEYATETEPTKVAKCNERNTTTRRAPTMEMSRVRRQENELCAETGSVQHLR